MSYAEEIVSGAICRFCLIPLKGEAPGHSRVCADCYPEMTDELEPWEESVGPQPEDVS